MRNLGQAHSKRRYVKLATKFMDNSADNISESTLLLKENQKKRVLLTVVWFVVVDVFMSLIWIALLNMPFLKDIIVGLATGSYSLGEEVIFDFLLDNNFTPLSFMV